MHAPRRAVRPGSRCVDESQLRQRWNSCRQSSIRLPAQAPSDRAYLVSLTLLPYSTRVRRDRNLSRRLQQESGALRMVLIRRDAMSGSDRVQSREALGVPTREAHGTADHPVGRLGPAGPPKSLGKDARRIRLEVQPPTGITRTSTIQGREALGGAPRERTHGTSEHSAGDRPRLETSKALGKDAKRIRLEITPPHGLKRERV
jgi:hypothetical protein